MGSRFTRTRFPHVLGIKSSRESSCTDLAPFVARERTRREMMIKLMPLSFASH